MARPKAVEVEGAGSDSFLDVVTNIVGILIILVMIVGERAKHIVVDVAKAAPSAQLVSARTESQRLEEDIHRLTNLAAEVQVEAHAKSVERGRLSVLVAAVEKDLDERRQNLDGHSRERYEFDRELAIVHNELRLLEEERRSASDSFRS